MHGVGVAPVATPGEAPALEDVDHVAVHLTDGAALVAGHVEIERDAEGVQRELLGVGDVARVVAAGVLPRIDLSCESAALDLPQRGHELREDHPVAGDAAQDRHRLGADVGVDPRLLGRDAAATQHGVAERADGLGDGPAGEHRSLLGTRVQVGSEDGDRRVLPDDLLQILHHEARGVDAGVDQHGVVLRDAQLLAPLLVDHGIDLRHLRGVGADVHPRGVLVVAQLHVALVVLEPLAQWFVDGQLAASHPVPLLLELG